MGQAFDRDGNVLGEASGATKREVLEALEREHPNAVVRIRALELEPQAACVGPDGATGAVGSSGLSDEALGLRAAEVQERLGADAVGFKRQSLPPDRMLQFFTYKHLPLHLQEASEPFCLLAYRLVERYPSNPERTVALRKLLEAKDAAVRALLYQG